MLKYGEAKLMEPIYRMFKVIGEKDERKAKTLMAVVMQYIIEHYSNKVLQPKDVQQILRTVLLHEEDGKYYAMYVSNEIQVKAAGWLTLLAIDCPVTLQMMGDMVNQLAEALQGKNCIMLSADDVIALLEQVTGSFDSVLLERLQLNKEVYLAELRTFLVQ